MPSNSGLRIDFICLSLHFQAYVSSYTPMYVLECNKWAFVPINLYNFQQRISWLSHRWRTQRNAISNVNCRIQWIIESLNAPCAPWYSEEHACLSVINISTSTTFVCWVVGCGGLLLASLRSAPLKYISGTIPVHWCDNYLRYWREVVWLITVHWLGQIFINVTSNQVGLPAELKHINKRRKRNLQGFP